MFEILAEAAVQTGNGIGWLGVPAGGVIGTALVLIWQSARQMLANRKVTIHVGNEGERESSNASLLSTCVAHEGLVKLLDERHAALRADLAEIRGGVVTLLMAIGDKDTKEKYRNGGHKNG